MAEANALAKERARRDKEADRARGGRLFALLPWRADGVYRGADVARWFRTEGAASKHGLSHDGGRGVVVRKWSQLIDPDGAASQVTAADVRRDVSEILKASE